MLISSNKTKLVYCRVNHFATFILNVFCIIPGGTSDVEYDPKTGLLTVKTLPKSSPIELTVTASAEKTAQRSTAKVLLRQLPFNIGIF